MTFYHLCRNVGYASHSLETIFTNPFKLHALYNLYLENQYTNPNSNEYKLTAIVLDIVGHRFFFKPVGIKKDDIDKRSFLKLSFANEYLDAINLSIILHHKSVKSDDQILSNEL